MLALSGSQLGVVDVKHKTLTRLDTGFTAFGKLAVVGGGVADADAELTIVTVAGSAGKASAVVRLQVRLSLAEKSNDVHYAPLIPLCMSPSNSGKWSNIVQVPQYPCN